MTAMDIIRIFFSLLFVLGLMGLAFYVVRRTNVLGGIGSKPRDERRLRVGESLVIDPKNRLLLIERDAQEHLILVSSDQPALLIETISPTQPSGPRL